MKIYVMIFLQNPEGYAKKKRTGRKPKLDKRTKRRILKEVSNSTKGYRRIRAEIAPEVSPSTVYRVIKKAPHISRQRLRKFPALKQSHKDARIAFAINHITWTSEWNMVILGVDNCLNFGFRTFF